MMTHAPGSHLPFRASTLLVVLGLLPGACVTGPPQPIAAPAPASERQKTPTPTKSRPDASPTAALEEGPVGELPALTSPLPLETASPTSRAEPTPTASAADTGGVPARQDSLLTRITATTPPNVAAALRLIEDGRQQMDRGAYDAALDRFERAVAIDPTTPYGYYFLAQVNFLKKKYDQAIAFATRAAVLTPRTDAVLLGRVESLQGAVFEQAGRYPDARRAYQKAIEADPNNLAARVGIGRLTAEPSSP